jgi:feruloyl esterase
MELQPVFDYMDASTPDLSKFKARGGKLIQVASVNDTIVFSQGSSDYYERVSANMGGPQMVQSFYRLFEAPGLSHIQWQNGTTNPDANPPVAGPLQLHNLIVNWVENGIAPDNVVYTTESSTPVKKSLPICVYPAKQTYVSGSIYEATSYRCQ